MRRKLQDRGGDDEVSQKGLLGRPAATAAPLSSVAIVSFKSKYIAVAVVAAVVVAVAVGFVLVLENRSQHSVLLDSAAADARGRVLGELNLRASEVALRVADRVDAPMLTGDIAAISAQIELFKSDPTLLGVIVRDVSGRELYAWRRAGDHPGTITRSTITSAEGVYFIISLAPGTYRVVE